MMLPEGSIFGPKQEPPSMEGYREAKNSVLSSLGLRPSTEALNIGPQLLGLLVSHQSSTPLPLGRVQTGTSLCSIEKGRESRLPMRLFMIEFSQHPDLPDRPQCMTWTLLALLACVTVPSGCLFFSAPSSLTPSMVECLHHFLQNHEVQCLSRCKMFLN